jgi:hypothetical protein
MTHRWFQITVAGRSSEDKSERLPGEARVRPSLRERFRPALWPTLSSTKCVPVIFPKEKCGIDRGVKLNTYFHLLPTVEMTGAKLFLPSMPTRHGV